MNAPLPVTIEDMEMYRELLPEGYIEETLKLQQINQSTRQQLRESPALRKEQAIQEIEETQKFWESLSHSSKTFNNLKEAHLRYARDMEDLRKASVRLSEIMAEISQNIRRNIKSGN